MIPAEGKEGMGDVNFIGPAFREFALVMGGEKSMAGRGNGPGGTIRPPARSLEKLYTTAVSTATHTHTHKHTPLGILQRTHTNSADQQERRCSL